LGCGHKSEPSGAPEASGKPAADPAAKPADPPAKPAAAAPPDAAPAAPAAPALPAGMRALVAADPMPKLGDNEMLLLAATVGGSVVITAPDGKKIEVREGVIAKTAAMDELPGGLTFEQADKAEIIDPGKEPHTAQLVTRAEDSGDFVHHEAWFVPTVGTRVKLGDSPTSIEADWSDPQHRWAVVLLDEVISLVDVKTGAATKITDLAGSPSFDSAGTLYYRTLDGGAWKWTGDHAVKIGKGKRGKPAKGDLNEGFEPAEYPAEVTFDAAGKPKFK
jgi:hypothetical protein